jgi:hypothetical protein
MDAVVTVIFMPFGQFVAIPLIREVHFIVLHAVTVLNTLSDYRESLLQCSLKKRPYRGMYLLP